MWLRSQHNVNILQLRYGNCILITTVELAYRLIPVHPDDYCLLSVEWEYWVYYDTKLPFSLRSVPKIFNPVANGLEWCICQRGVQCIFHYLDDLHCSRSARFEPA